MNKILLWFSFLMAWGNPLALEDLREEGKTIGFWEHLGW